MSALPIGAHGIVTVGGRDGCEAALVWTHPLVDTETVNTGRTRNSYVIGAALWLSCWKIYRCW